MPEENKYFLKSKRLGFRPWTKKDLKLAVELWGDPEVTKNIVSTGTLSEDEINERLNKEIETFEKYKIQYWPIFLLVNHEFVGCCGLRPYGQKRILEIGFHICSKHWRKGFASEADKAAIQYAFDELDVTTLFAGHNSKNEASRYLLLKLGFNYTHDEFYEPTGLMHPSYVLSSEEYSKIVNT